MSVKPIDYDALLTKVQQEVIPIWQARSILSLFQWVPIPEGIAVSSWARKYLLQTQGAAWTAAGFDPNFVTISYQGYSLEIDTIAQSMQLEEQDIAFYRLHGFFDKSVSQLGENGAKTANLAFFTGLDEAGGSPHSTQYNFFMEEGTSNGSAARPLMAANNGSAGAWTSFANIDKDVALLLGGMESKGYPKKECLVIYPAAFDPVMMMHLTEQQGLSIGQWISSNCAGIMAVPDDYLPTDLTSTPTLPTTANSDIFAVHLPSIIIGYTRAERLRIVPPYGTVRTTTVEFEVWPVPVFIPKPFVTTTSPLTTTKYYKGVGMIDGVAV